MVWGEEQAAAISKLGSGLEYIHIIIVLIGTELFFRVDNNSTSAMKRKGKTQKKGDNWHILLSVTDSECALVTSYSCDRIQ